MMRFKIKTTAGAALAVATVAAFISIVFGVVLALQPTSILICSCGLFVLLFFAAHYLFNLFVRYRIKPIYQVLLSKNIRTHDLPPTHNLEVPGSSPGWSTLIIKHLQRFVGAFSFIR